MRRRTVGRPEKTPRTDMTKFQLALKEQIPGTIPLGERTSRLRAAQRRLSTQRLERLFAEQDATERGSEQKRRN